MKTKITLWIPAILIALFSLFLVTSCKKDDSVIIDANKPIVYTFLVKEVKETTALCGGGLKTDGGAAITERGLCWSTSQNPTTADNKTIDVNNGIEDFYMTISGLTDNTTYYVRAYAINRIGTSYGEAYEFTTFEDRRNIYGDIEFNPNITYGSMKDIDGNTYKTVTIGTQTWMAENLKATKYNDGTVIPNITKDYEWSGLTTGALRDYDNLPTYSEVFGKLYNGYAVFTDKLCPTGWHVPTHMEWGILKDYLIKNGYNYDGYTYFNEIAKAMAGSSFWESSSLEGSIGNNDYPEIQNASGFTAIPSGSSNHSFMSLGNAAYWWSSTEDNENPKKAFFWYLGSEYSHLGYNGLGGYKDIGFSVRCVRD